MARPPWAEWRRTALEAVTAAADTKDRAKLDQAVADARRLGATWQQITDAAGLPREAGRG